MRAEIYTTEFLDRQAVCRKAALQFQKEEQNQEVKVINLYPEVTYQEILGFGGAVTDAAVSVLEQMDEKKQQDILNAYFGEEGMGYRFIRTPIDSCDFSRTQYCAYNPSKEGGLDKEALENGAGAILKYIKKIQEIAKGEIEVMLTPWSPPAALKTNGAREGGGKLRREEYEKWAEYICAYIKEYRTRGIPVTMLSVQNEPNATQTWDSCLFTPKEEKEMVTAALYPAMKRNGLQDIDIYIWDHNKERVYERTRDMIDQENDHMIAGVAFHWYSGDHFEGLQLIRKQYPDKKLLFSEGCIEYSRFDEDNQLKNAQLYVHDMIGNFNAGMNTFIDWNIVLDKDGGPNYVNNLCESPIMCDTLLGSFSKKLSYYYLEHFSRYIKPGARRIACTRYSGNLEVLSVKNPDGDIAIVVYNKEKRERKFYLRLEGEIAECRIPAMGIGTIKIEEDGKHSVSDK